MSTSIEWCDEVWNPVLGCTRVSAGCDHCYAMGVAHRKMSSQHIGLTKLRSKDAKRPGIDWTGEVRTLPERLGEPLHWRKPRRVFVNSMSDLFHPSVPFDFVLAVFGVMAMASHHTYLVLTKRPERAVEFLRGLDEASRPFGRHCREFAEANGNRIAPDTRVYAAVNAAERAGVVAPNLASATQAYGEWPLRNVHLGVSAEDQATFDERVPLLAECPAAVRFLSVEPLLGPIDMRQAIYREPGLAEFVGEFRCTWPEILGMNSPSYRSQAWVIVGGESGPGARPCDVAWVRSIVQQCRDVGTACFVKQLGARPMMRADSIDGRAAGDDPEREWPEGTRFTTAPGHMGTQWHGRWARLRDRKGGDMSEWPSDLRVRQLPEVRHA